MQLIHVSATTSTTGDDDEYVYYSLQISDNEDDRWTPLRPPPEIGIVHLPLHDYVMQGRSEWDLHFYPSGFL